MTTIPLAPVVTFLRKRGALNVLEGAPVLGPARDPFFCSALSGASLVEMAGPCELRGSHLYLGTSDVCPAAEGWASRVLAMARHCSMPCYVQDCGSFLCMWPMPQTLVEPYFIWQWVEHSFGANDEWARLPGPAPRNPAERLRAVLLHELERA